MNTSLLYLASAVLAGVLAVVTFAQGSLFGLLWTLIVGLEVARSEAPEKRGDYSPVMLGIYGALAAGNIYGAAVATQKGIWAAADEILVVAIICVWILQQLALRAKR